MRSVRLIPAESTTDRRPCKYRHAAIPAMSSAVIVTTTKKLVLLAAGNMQQPTMRCLLLSALFCGGGLRAWLSAAATQERSGLWA